MDDYEQKVRVMRKAFMTFDIHKTGFVDTDKIDQILNHMGQLFDDNELQALIDETDVEGNGKVNFDGFCRIAGKFMEEEDEQATEQELKDAFRMFDKEGNGYITTTVLREILAALDEKLTNDDLDGMIDEIDSVRSGTVHFKESGEYELEELEEELAEELEEEVEGLEEGQKKLEEKEGELEPEVELEYTTPVF